MAPAVTCVIGYSCRRKPNDSGGWVRRCDTIHPTILPFIVILRSILPIYYPSTPITYPIRLPSPLIPSRSPLSHPPLFHTHTQPPNPTYRAITTITNHTSPITSRLPPNPSPTTAQYHQYHIPTPSHTPVSPTHINPDKTITLSSPISRSTLQSPRVNARQ